MNPPSPANAHLFGSDTTLVPRVFPFFIEWDVDLCIVSVGPSLAKISEKALSGSKITDVFILRRPVGEMTADFFRDNGSLLFLFETISNGIILRGEIVILQESDTFLMLAAPWISNPDDLERLGLTFSDFAIHDQTVDMLQIIQTQRMANDDLQTLATKLTSQRALLRQKEAEARKLAIIASRTDNAVVVTDAKGNIEWVNDGFVKLTGWELEEVFGKKPGSVLQGPDTDPATVHYMHSQLSKGEGFKIEIINYSKTGRKYWISSEVQPIRDEFGKIINFMAIQSDITDRKDADRVLHETNTLQSAMLDGAGFAIISTNPEGEIQLFNEAAERMLGYAVREVIENKMTPAAFHDIDEVTIKAHELTLELGREIKPGFDAFVAKAKLGQPDQNEWTYIRKDGSRLPVLLSVSAMFDVSSEVCGYLGIATDLTERKLTEERLRTTLSEVELLNRIMMAREERVLELKHEINSIYLRDGLPAAYPSATEIQPSDPPN